MLFALLVCSSAASLPTRPGFTCELQDRACWKEQVLWYGKTLPLTVDILTLEREKVAVLEARIVSLRKDYDDASKMAEAMAQRALKAADRPWHESPALWSSITAVVVAALAIGIAQGLKVSIREGVLQ